MQWIEEQGNALINGLAAFYHGVLQRSPNCCFFLWPAGFEGATFLLHEWGWEAFAQRDAALGESAKLLRDASCDADTDGIVTVVRWSAAGWECLLWPDSTAGGLREIVSPTDTPLRELAFEMARGGFWFDANDGATFDAVADSIVQVLLPDAGTPAEILELRDAV